MSSTTGKEMSSPLHGFTHYCIRSDTVLSVESDTYSKERVSTVPQHASYGRLEPEELD